MPITSPKPAIGVHLDQTVKTALERAAREDSRSVSSMAAKIITDWLRREGDLKDMPL